MRAGRRSKEQQFSGQALKVPILIRIRSEPGDRKKVVELLMQDAQEKGYPFQLHALSTEEMNELESYFPGKFQVTWPRDYEDYVYETEKLINLSGKKYHGKKNHINQFKAAYPDWS